MNRLLLLLVTFFFSITAWSQTPKLDTLNKRLSQLDNVLKAGKGTRYLSPSTFDTIVFRQQVLIGGSALLNTRKIGTSATVEDKSVAISVGSLQFPVRFRSHKGRGFVQANLKGSSEKGFASIFSKDQYQNTLSGGISGFLFTRQPAVYNGDHKDSLHRQLRLSRNTDLLALAQISSADAVTWEAKYIKPVQDFLKAFPTSRPIPAPIAPAPTKRQAKAASPPQLDIVTEPIFVLLREGLPVPDTRKVEALAYLEL
jgi:hypothetical protein